MASDRPVASAGAAHSEEGDLAKAFQELAKGERTATALEAQLSAMESKIDALLQQAEKEQQDIEGSKDSAGQSSGEATEKKEGNDTK